MSQGQVQKNKTTTSKTTDEAEVVEAKDVKNEKLDEHIDDILEAIDECIGELGEEFALHYVQQGGE